MGRKCCVTGCNNDYKNNKVCRLPSEKHKPEERARWIKAIPRDNIPEGNDVAICDDHWPTGYEKIIRYGKERPRDPPSIFSSVKQSLIPTPPPPPRPTTKAHSNSRNMQEDELSQFSKLDLIKSIDEICNLQLFSSRVSFSTKCFVMKLDCVRIQSHQFVQGTSVPDFLLLIRDDFTNDAYHYGIKTTVKSLSQNRITNLKRWSHIQEAIRYLNNCDVSGIKDVLREMICSMGPTPVGKKKYEIETLIRAFEYFSVSRSAYFRFRRDYELPSVDTLTRITSKVRNAGDDAFLNQIFGSLENRQKTCYLLIDEV